VLKVELTGQRVRIVTGSDRNVFGAEKFVSLIRQKPSNTEREVISCLPVIQ